MTRVQVVEVSARDGLQNDPAFLTTEQKVVRSQFKALPISSLVVARMNALYQADEGVSATPVNQPTVQVQQPTEPSDLHVGPPGLQAQAGQPALAMPQDLNDEIPPLVDDDDDDDDNQEVTAAMVADLHLEEMLEELEEPDAPTPNRRARRENMRKPSRYIVNHISLRKGLSLYGTDAERSIQQEILNMKNKDVFAPVHISSLSREERRRIIRSSMHLPEGGEVQS